MTTKKIRFGELFSGVGLANLAFREVFGEDAECVFFSEINRACVKLYEEKFPGHRNLGDISLLEDDDIRALPDFDFLIGGSPCQNLSVAGSGKKGEKGDKREGLDGEESGLFYKYLDILRIKQPKWFLLENVGSMKESDRDEISRCLQVEPVLISSESFTGQRRMRYYWTNFPFKAPALTGNARDARWIIDKTVMPTEALDWKAMHSVFYDGVKRGKTWLRDYSSDWDIVSWSRSTRYDGSGKSRIEQRVKVNMGANTLVTGKGCHRFSSKNFVRHKSKIRSLTRVECARLQGIPDGHLDSMSDNAAFSAIGNSFTLPVIVFLLKSFKESIKC